MDHQLSGLTNSSKLKASIELEVTRGRLLSKETIWISVNTSSQLVSLIDGTDLTKRMLTLIQSMASRGDWKSYATQGWASSWTIVLKAFYRYSKPLNVT